MRVLNLFFVLLTISMIFYVNAVFAVDDLGGTQAFIVELAGKFPLLLSVLSIIGIVLFAAQGVVLATQTKKDDKFVNDKIKKNKVLGFLWNLFLSFAPSQKGSKGLELSSKNTD